MLEGYRVAILERLDGTALAVGRLLREAKQIDPDRFDEWVQVCLPIGHETARRLIAISAAYEKLPEELVANLPRPWQALYAIQALPMEALQAGMASGELSSLTTVREAQQFSREWRGVSEARVRRADIAAGALMQFPASDLSPETTRALRRWLKRESAPDTLGVASEADCMGRETATAM